MIFLFWIGFAIIVGVAANNRGRNGIGWCLLAVVISPLLAGLLLFAMPRQSLCDIATLAMIEATPEGSRSRQLLAEHEAKAARKAEAKAARKATTHWFWGHDNYRPWSPRSSSTPNGSFSTVMTVWIILLLLGGVGLIGYKSKPQAVSTVAAQSVPKPQQSKQMDCINSLMMLDRLSGNSTGGWLFPDLSKYEAACSLR